MKSFSTDLQNLLASNVPVYRVDLFQIGPLLNGAMIYATNGGAKISFGGNVYDPVVYGSWERADLVTKIGLESNSVNLTVYADNQVPVYFPGTSNGALLMDGIKYGMLGAAPVTIYTAYMTTYGVVLGPFLGSLVETKFIGQCTKVNRVGQTSAEIVVQDLIYLLNRPIPRRIIQPGCDWVLYSPGCTLSATSFQRTNSVGTILGSYIFNPTSNLTPISPSGTFTQGYLTWTSGKNNGLSNFIRLWTPAGPDIIQLDVQPIFPLTVSDTFVIHEGCNKTFTSCLNLQGSTNAPKNFGGAPTVPVPETAL